MSRRGDRFGKTIGEVGYERRGMQVDPWAIFLMASTTVSDGVKLWEGESRGLAP